MADHKDDEPDLDTHNPICSVSLCKTRTTISKRPNHADETTEFNDDSLLMMKHPTNLQWIRGIPVQTDRRGSRISVTFPKIARQDKRKAEGTMGDCYKKTKLEDSKVIGAVTENDISDCVFFHLGDSVFVFATTVKGNVSVHIRRYKKFGKMYCPTQGVTLQPGWIGFIMGRQEIPKSEKDLQDGFFRLKDQIKIKSSDFVDFTFTTVKIPESIIISGDQWRQMMNLCHDIFASVLDQMYSAMDFYSAYRGLYKVRAKALPMDGCLPSCLDTSLGDSHVTDLLGQSLCQLLMKSGELKYPPTQTDGLCANRVEAFNAAALCLDVNKLALNFYDSLWDKQPFLQFRSEVYVTRQFLKNVCLDDILRRVRKRLCPDKAYELS